jgi:hypothetical protein
LFFIQKYPCLIPEDEIDIAEQQFLLLQTENLPAIAAMEDAAGRQLAS